MGRAIVFHLPRSAHDINSVDQLAEVEALSSNLPSVEEMKQMAARTYQSEEVEDLKRSHKKALNKVKRENSKLSTQLQKAELIIEKKDLEIATRKTLLERRELTNRNVGAGHDWWPN